jgi:hypothetical protein
MWRALVKKAAKAEAVPNYPGVDEAALNTIAKNGDLGPPMVIVSETPVGIL